MRRHHVMVWADQEKNLTMYFLLSFFSYYFVSMSWLDLGLPSYFVKKDNKSYRCRPWAKAKTYPPADFCYRRNKLLRKPVIFLFHCLKPKNFFMNTSPYLLLSNRFFHKNILSSWILIPKNIFPCHLSDCQKQNLFAVSVLSGTEAPWGHKPDLFSPSLHM